MFTVVSPEQIDLVPGSVLRFPADWGEYLAMVDRLADRTTPRIKYRNGEILLRAPMVRHGREVNDLADFAKFLLEHLDCNYAAFTPITIKLPEISGIEPDYCFYINNFAAIATKDRIDFGIDPAPDLVIEVDVTSFTDVQDYLPYSVPEVWLWCDRLAIYQLVAGEYVETMESRYFPGLNLNELSIAYLITARNQGTMPAKKELRQKL
jgi:Uma2 family endonuclease